MNKFEQFDSFYMQHINELILYAYKMIKDYHAAEDLVHDTYCLAYEKNILLNHANPNAWFYIVIKNKVSTYYKKANKMLFDSTQLVESGEVDINYFYAEMSQTMKSILTQEEFYIINKIYYIGIPEKEIADELMIKENALRQRVHKIKEKIINGFSTLYSVVIFIIFR